MDNSTKDYRVSSTETKRRGSSGLAYIILVIVISYVWISPSSSKFVMNSEASANGYALAAELWPPLSSEAKGKVAWIYKKGYLTRNDITKIISIALDEKPAGEGVSSQPSKTYGDDPSLSDGWMWREVTGELASYKAKDAFEAELQAAGVTWASPAKRDGFGWWILCPWCAPPSVYAR
ncbi:hypothetical protein [Pseudomonas sp. GOM6]|uniref:hypothetical protein n=1 Tax=Pseudomonas sp. GOM6 TaxID=3036944 RepID=UPI002409466F|nr:hypothetical protein [Pseudomonas sp. GOM6]MDG1581069.1 hypothetical protein [Pseudomonas sp. GOM6]